MNPDRYHRTINTLLLILLFVNQLRGINQPTHDPIMNLGYWAGMISLFVLALWAIYKYRTDIVKYLATSTNGSDAG